jgi:hypothetical protein
MISKKYFKYVIIAALLIIISIYFIKIAYDKNVENQNKIIRAQDNVTYICQMIIKYNSLEENFITKLTDLKGKFIVGANWPLKDPWKNEFILDLGDSLIISKGPDGIIDTSDDIFNNFYIPAKLSNAKLEFNHNNSTDEINSQDILHLYFNKDIELPMNKGIRLNEIFNINEHINKISKYKVNDIDSFLNESSDKLSYGLNSQEILVFLPAGKSKKIITGIDAVNIDYDKSIFTEILRYETQEINHKIIKKGVRGNKACGYSKIYNFNDKKDENFIKIVKSIIGVNIDDLFDFIHKDKIYSYEMYLNSSIYLGENLCVSDKSTLRSLNSMPNMTFKFIINGNTYLSINIIKCDNSNLAQNSFNLINKYNKNDNNFNDFTGHGDTNEIKITGNKTNVFINCIIFYNALICRISVHNINHKVIDDNCYYSFIELINLIKKILRDS